MQVNEKKGLSFAEGLRSVLRQDPDVILIGEMRDKMTIEIPGRPIRVKDSVYMCMSSFRILARRS